MVGISTHSIQGVRDAARHPEIDVIHPLINIKGMGIIDGTADEMLEAIGEAHSAGKFIYAMKSLAGGNFVPDREKALRFVFSRKDIDAAVVGMVTPLEVEWNVRFLSGLSISDELSQKTALQSKRLNIVEIACTGCGECVAHCENEALSIVDGQGQGRPWSLHSLRLLRPSLRKTCDPDCIENHRDRGGGQRKEGYEKRANVDSNSRGRECFGNSLNSGFRCRDAGVILAHGAGNDMNHPMLSFLAEGLANEGYIALRFNFVYREMGKKAPDNQELLYLAWKGAYRFLPNIPISAKAYRGGGKIPGRKDRSAVGGGRNTLPPNALSSLDTRFMRQGKRTCRGTAIYTRSRPRCSFSPGRGTRFAICNSCDRCCQS